MCRVIFLWVLVAVCWLPSVASGQKAKGTKAKGAGIVGQLDRVAGNVFFDEMPLPDACAVIEKQNNIKLAIDLQAIGVAGLDARMPITIRLSGFTIRGTLAHMLHNHGLEYLVDGESIRVVPLGKDGPIARKPSPAQQGSHDKLKEKLEAPVGVAFATKSLKDIVTTLSDEAGVPILLDEYSLKKDGQYGLVQTSASAKGKVPLRQALAIVFAPLGLTASIDEEALVVRVRDPKAVEEMSKEVQAAAQAKVTLKANGMPLGIAIANLQEQVKAPFVFELRKLHAAKIPISQKISVDVTDVPLPEALRQILGPLQLKAEARGDVIAITTVK